MTNTELLLSLLLSLVILAQVYFIYYHNPQIHSHYLPIIIIPIAVVFAYLLVLYAKTTLQKQAKANIVLT
jgi:hypothetical protein